MESAIKIIGNDLKRASVKIGWLSGNDIFDEEGLKLGFYEDDKIFAANGKKIGYLKNGTLYAADGREIRIDENRKHVTGGAYSDLCRAAVRLLLGE